MLRTARLHLVRWADQHREPFAAMNADPAVMWDFGFTLSRVESDAKLDRYETAWRENGLSRWAVEDLDGRYLGYVGVLPGRAEHPLGPHHEIGWRLVRVAWGQGYATEAARAAIDDAFARTDLDEIVAYTAPDNHRSQAVMARAGLVRDAARDFEIAQADRHWRGLVWAIKPRR
jgi:RimJ/RimL family protein N-acetyltransferase